MQKAPPIAGKLLDTFFLCLLLVGGGGFYILESDWLSSHWDWGALGRAFFRSVNAESLLPLTPGPLGTGLLNTLRLAVWTMGLTAFYGTCLAMLGITRIRALRMVSFSIIAATRNLPPLVLVFIIHFFLAGPLTSSFSYTPIVENTLLSLFFPAANRIPAFISALITLTLYEGAYVAEIIRGGIESVPHQQWEAGESLGFSRFAVLRLIVFPQALRFMIPSLTGQTTALIKDSAIVSVISVQELTFQGTEYMTSSGLAAEVWLGVTACYLCLCALAVFGGRLIEQRQRWD